MRKSKSRKIKPFVKVTELISDRAKILDQKLYLARQAGDELAGNALSPSTDGETESLGYQGDFPRLLALVKEIAGDRTHVFQP